MHLQHVCLLCLRHGRQHSAARLSTAVQGTPALTKPSPRPPIWPQTSQDRQYATIRRCLSTSPKLEKRSKGGDRRRNRTGAATPSEQGSSPAIEESKPGTEDGDTHSIRNNPENIDTRRCLEKFVASLRADVEQRSVDDASIATRKLGEWDLEPRFRTATKIDGLTLEPSLLISKLNSLSKPLKQHDTISALKFLESAFEKDENIVPAKRGMQDAIRGTQKRRSASKDSASATSRRAADGEANPRSKARVAKLDTTILQTIDASKTNIVPLLEGDVDVPKLSFDLSRVLFNPGVYQLQDPRSRVYNFDPYLEKIMPVTEFDFGALNEYITSSGDDKLRSLALEIGKRYIGSSSSMTASLSQFHFLISAWREPEFKNLSKSFKEDSYQFTRITRAPSAVFLRWREGVYAMDADKEYDSANILMSLGKSIEKLLTLEKNDFEKYRKSERVDGQLVSQKPEQYHYGQVGNFLMRSQLDAHDPRLPGSGMFDLKTRAVAAVRMSLADHEKGQGYEIRDLFGTWESYEREYYDMVRSAFLKYSLQVRMGRMDGIFVAFHNIERIFGFQYISLAEMDQALHGQSNPALGDQEFGLSVKLMEDIFDRMTKQFPEQSLRIYFEVREPTEVQEETAYMHVFAEPFTEAEIEATQKKAQEEIEAYEYRLFNGLNLHREESAATAEEVLGDAIESEEADENSASSEEAEGSTPHAVRSNDADVEFLNELSNVEIAQSDAKAREEAQHAQQSGGKNESPGVIGFRVVVRNNVNGKPVGRVQDLDTQDDWKLEYNIVEMSSAQAVAKYRLCKARRAAALKQALTRPSDKDFFLAKMYGLSDAGREWRRQQDEVDAQRGQTVLYNTDT
jgi:hypothetical protein